MIRWVIATQAFDEEVCDVLQAIVDSEISPELVPGDRERGSQPIQRTEEAIGPFELQDFNLYYISRFGYRPSKVAFMANHAWGESEHRSPDDNRKTPTTCYSLANIREMA
jgi:NAD+ synthase (glutamine-hydrolysing)